MTTPSTPKSPVVPRIAGLLVAVIGIVFLIGGIFGWFTVRAELIDENITVSDDADRFAGDRVDGPLSAYSQAETVKRHVLEATDGKTYAQLDMDDSNRDLALQGSTVRSALMTSTLSFGVSALAGTSGVAFTLIGGVLAVRRR
ncbi:Putative membrane protein [Corynebacterium glyciniphilum AJ 3170]|uniref:Putative membrane protein n=1 Tax=Corynebacterium glyciniphilum AJ 3170 TaxID=1404245 RepID=X5EDL1_9CORY|nr:hypothetical protein [Corynebacterium glyciniphilum]AHW64696.1 Putative membrane protein [Corynebacterium glyciniphilum AJ 3170]